VAAPGPSSFHRFTSFVPGPLSALRRYTYKKRDPNLAFLPGTKKYVFFSLLIRYFVWYHMDSRYVFYLLVIFCGTIWILGYVLSFHVEVISQSICTVLLILTLSHSYLNDFGQIMLIIIIFCMFN
jgi:hypothetical protein